jgi:hypothetical protein
VCFPATARHDKTAYQVVSGNAESATHLISGFTPACHHYSVSQIMILSTPRLRRLRFILLVWLWITIVIFSTGLIIAFSTDESGDAGHMGLFGLGMISAALMVVVSFLMPSVRCPRCLKPFFVPQGARGYLCTINLGVRQCLHCSLDLRIPPDESKNANKL